MDEIIIMQNQSKQKKSTMAGIIMTLASLFVFIVGCIDQKLIYIMTGIIGITFFGFCLITLLRRQLKPKAILEINNKGIIDNSFPSSVGFIGWEEIEDVFIKSYFSKRYIAVKVYDIARVLRSVSPLKAIGIKINDCMRYKLLYITLECTDADINDVLEEILERLKEYQLRVRSCGGIADGK